MNIQTVVHKGLTFLNVTSPGELELKYLIKDFEFDSLHLDDYVNHTQSPKIEVFKNYSLIVLDIPLFNVSTPAERNGRTRIESLLNLPQVPFQTVPLPQFSSPERRRRILASQVDFFIGSNYVVVLHDGMLPAIDDIFSLCQKTLANRNKYMSQGSVFLAYRIIDALIDGCFPVVSELYAAIDRVDNEIDAGRTETTLESISLTRRNIVVFHTMIKPILPLFHQLEEGKFKELNGSMKPFWSNILDHLQKIWDRLEDSRELIEGISESHESFLTQKTNEIVKVLTIFSAIVLPLNLFASMYGMNIRGLPFANHELSFWGISLFMLFIAIVMLLTFRIKRWF